MYLKTCNKHLSLEGIVPKFQVILLEGAALVFLIITIPIWLPIAFALGAIALIIATILAIIGAVAYAGEIGVINEAAVVVGQVSSIAPFP